MKAQIMFSNLNEMLTNISKLGDYFQNLVSSFSLKKLEDWAQCARIPVW